MRKSISMGREIGQRFEGIQGRDLGTFDKRLDGIRKRQKRGRERERGEGKRYDKRKIQGRRKER